MTQFNFTYDPGVSLQQMIGMEMAGKVWSQYLQDGISLDVHVGMSSNLPDMVIGGALPAMTTGESFKKVREALFNDASSVDDGTALDYLLDQDKLSADFDWILGADDGDFESKGRGRRRGNSQEASIWQELKKLNLTDANAKALGLKDDNKILDGYILLSNVVPWSYDFTRSAPIASNKLDFLSTAMHEIGHLLGFVSSVDDPGWLFNASTAYNAGELTGDYEKQIKNRADNAMPLDLFRFNYNTASDNPDLSYGALGGMKGFSIDGGETIIAAFSQGANTQLSGDGEQASHWIAGTKALMAPTLTVGTRIDINSLDLRALDVVGWDIALTGANTNYDLSMLQAQVKQGIAARLGKTVDWLNANQTVAAKQLGQNREADIEKMINKSQIYNWGTGGDGWWQRVLGLFQQRGLFSSVDMTSASIPTSAVVPPSATIGWNAFNDTMPSLPENWQPQIDLSKSSDNLVEVIQGYVQRLESTFQGFELTGPKYLNSAMTQYFETQLSSVNDQPGVSNPSPHCSNDGDWWW